MLNLASPALEILESEQIPSCPSVMSSVMDALNDPHTTLTDLAQLLSTDPNLTIRILKLVNSAYYGLPRTVHSVEEAAFRLGFRELWALAVAIQMSSMYQDNGSWSDLSQGLWKHSLKTAILAKHISKHAQVGSPEELFTGGILHDIGKLTFSCFDPEGYPLFLKSSGALGQFLVEEERIRWGIGHDELGAALLRRWAIPESLARMVERHHFSEEADHSNDASIVVLSAADALAHAAQCERMDGSDPLVRLDFSAGLISEEMVTTLNLERADCVRLVTDSIRQFDELIGSFK